MTKPKPIIIGYNKDVNYIKEYCDIVNNFTESTGISSLTKLTKIQYDFIFWLANEYQKLTNDYSINWDYDTNNNFAGQSNFISQNHYVVNLFENYLKNKIVRR